MTARYPILYLPSEIHNRDWDSRLLIADHAAALGFASVVGQQWAIQSSYERLPPGLILIKTVNEIQLNAAEAFAKAGHLVIAMDEESLAVAPDQNFLGILSPRLPKVCHQFFANSPMHAETLLRLMPSMEGKVVTTGNARTDLLVASGRVRFAAEAEAIRKETGPYVLFNSNRALDDSIWNSHEHFMKIQLLAGAVNPDDEESVKRFEQQFVFERHNAKAFIDALHACLRDISTHRIVVRPHPVERPDFWMDMGRQYPRLHVADNTDHIPWIMAADAVVHTNSTTGLEAALLERPTVNLVPNMEGHWENLYVGTRVNPFFIDWQEGVRALTEFLATGEGRLSRLQQEKSELRRYFPNAFDGDSAQKIAAHMAAAMREQSELAKSPPDLPDVLRSTMSAPERHEIQKRKFTKKFGEAQGDFKQIRKVTRLPHNVNIAQIVEGCFAILPH